MILAAGLVVSRLVHYLSASVLFGAAFFPSYGVVPGERSIPFLARLLFWAALTALLSALSWFLFTAAGMIGTLAGMRDPATLSIVAGQTEFGHVWMARLALAAALTALLAIRHNRLSNYAVPIGSAVLIASIALTGHSGADASPNASLHIAVDTLHLLATSVWIGALFVLPLMLAACAHSGADGDAAACNALLRFSGIGEKAVALLVATGILNTWFIVGPRGINALFTTLYGRVLVTKILLFAAMIIFAIVNRFRLTPALASALAANVSTRRAISALRASVTTETAIAVLVLAAVALLGTLPPHGAE